MMQIEEMLGSILEDLSWHSIMVHHKSGEKSAPSNIGAGAKKSLLPLDPDQWLGAPMLLCAPSPPALAAVPFALESHATAF